MGWSFKRSVKMGPLRVNFSTRGVGVSAGVRGARVGIGPRGTYVSVGHGGFQYRHKISSSAKPASSSAQPAPSQPLVDAAVMAHPGAIETASAAELAASSIDALVAEIQSRLRKPNLFAWYVAVAALVALLSGAPVPVSLLALVCAIPIYRWDRERRTARVIYDVDQSEIVERLALANEAGNALGAATKLWHISHMMATSDWKKNAGASKLIKRTATRSVPGSLPRVELNVEPYCVPVGPQQLLLLPDRLLVWDGRALAGLAYERLVLRADSKRFIEEEGIPSDARQVDTTWRYVNKKGGPDRRFKDNVELPVMEYGELTIESPEGLRIVLQLSKPAAAEEAAAALRQLGRRTFTSAEEQEPNTTTPRPASAPQESVTAGSDPGTSPESAAASGIATLLRYIAAADRRVDEAESALAREVIAQLLPPGHPDVERLSTSFRSLPTDERAVAAAVGVLAGTSDEYRRWVASTLQRMSLADGKTTPKERERISEVTRALGV